MKATGKVLIATHVFITDVLLSIELENGEQWQFHGTAFGVGVVGFGTSYDQGGSGDYPGLSHMEGSCAFEVAAGAVGEGGLVVHCYDLQGLIGTFTSTFVGVDVTAGGGWGTWKKQNWK